MNRFNEEIKQVVLERPERESSMRNITSIVRIILVLCLFSFTTTEAFAGISTVSDKNICPVHGIKMESRKLRIVYGMPSQLEFEEMRVGKALFPYGRDYVLAGCVVKPQKFRKGFVCSKCVKERRAWITSKNRWNELSKASRASLEEFFVIVNSRDIDEALKSMAPAMIDTPEKLKSWRRHLSAIRSIHVLHAEPANTDDWSGSRHIFKVTLEAYVEDVPDAPIPFFGWHDNPNVRWVVMERNSTRRWLVAAIATGP